MRCRLMKIQSAAVLGAGVMGAQIAAHLANAGVPVALLDVTRDAARDGLNRARTIKPDAFFTPDLASLIRTGSFDDDLETIRTADWIIEAVVERIEPKRALLARVDALRGATTIVSTNTSGIPVSTIADGRSDSFRTHFLGTHFFNPPRYLRLVELIPTADTDAAVASALAHFINIRLGKGVVIAKDTPNFIGNRIALFEAAQVLRAVNRGDVTIEEVDAITGPAIGRPKSATFRTMDIAGIDVLADVAANLRERLADEDERSQFVLPGFVDRMLERGLKGAKSGRGFYEKRGDDILTLDPATLEYRPRQSVRLPSLDAAKSIASTTERVRTLMNGQDKVGAFLRSTLKPTLDYAARITPQIAESPDDVDRAISWGFGWEVGPLTIRQALDGKSPVANASTGVGDRPVVKRNPGASLIDFGDGVLCVEFHSKMNAIGGDTIQMLHAGIKEASENFAALVVGNDAVNFSAGANLMLLLLEAQEGNWEEVDLMVRAFQSVTSAIRCASVPVVVATAGLTLGGATEISLHAARVQAHAETYMGLVEAGVGLIPAGGGTKEMLARAMEATPSRVDPLPAVQRVFETIGFAKTSTSAADAARIGYLRDEDGVTMNRDRLMADAKRCALQLAATGYRPRRPREAIRVGGESMRATLKLGVHLAWRAGRISDHDALIGRKLAHVLAGGALGSATVTEQQLLDLEREAFLSLCGERKTLERIAHTLKTGKPLRN
jgi:3-hydroxyacyl-CoA dehydrogenase